MSLDEIYGTFERINFVEACVKAKLSLPETKRLWTLKSTSRINDIERKELAALLQRLDPQPEIVHS